ncbi:hypothetical protein LJC10_06395 [Selenomonadales bacterium OttesenSCG-928-I06]|nr:hypothetical protein [Selenomonadales bacterium OttesenSCG-928-I06]
MDNNKFVISQIKPSSGSGEVDPQIVAVITASISAVLGTNSDSGKVKFKVKRTNNFWAQMGRQSLMDKR